MKLKSQLKELLFKKDMTIAQLSRKSGVPRQTIADWMSGTSPRNLIHLKQVAEILDVSVDELCFGADLNKLVSASPLKALEEEIHAGIYEVILRKTT